MHRAGCQALPCLQVLLRQHMYIMADCTARERGRHDEHVLVHIEALPDGSFSMQPGTSTSSEAYRLEDASGQTLCTHKMARGAQLLMLLHDDYNECDAAPSRMNIAPASSDLVCCRQTVWPG